MPNNFERIIPWVLKHEGGWVNNKNDPGGATNWGISLRFLKDNLKGTNVLGIEVDLNNDGKVDGEDIRQMPQDKAIQIYRTVFWKPGYAALPDLTAAKTFDFVINAGTKQGVIFLQRACRAFGQILKDDGILGNITQNAVQTIADDAGIAACMSSEAAGFYRTLAVQDRYKEFLTGWLNRAYDAVKLAG